MTPEQNCEERIRETKKSIVDTECSIERVRHEYTELTGKLAYEVAITGKPEVIEYDFNLALTGNNNLYYNSAADKVTRDILGRLSRLTREATTLGQRLELLKDRLNALEDVCGSLAG